MSTTPLLSAQDLSLHGGTAIVTGGSRGIGRAIVLALAAQGMQVLATGRDTAALAETVAAAAGFAGQVTTATCELREPASIAALFAGARAQWPRLDLLVNNAGMGTFGPAADVSATAWDEVFAVDARGAFLVAQEAFRWMQAQPGGGRIINIASVVGLRGYVNQVAYSAAKHALMGATKVMAREGQAHGIRVAAICPGGVATDLVSKARPDLDLSTLIQPADVARAVLYLATEPATCCTDLIELRRAGATPWP